jgi:hypothetical protein
MKAIFNALHSEEMQFFPTAEDIVLLGTKAVILATAHSAGKLAYATDTLEFYLYDGTNWKVMPLELETETSTPDMGVYNQENSTGVAGFGVSDRAGYYEDALTDKDITNSRILGNSRAEEGAVRTTSGGVFQVYLNSTWNDVVINFVLREDANGTYELEHAPVGFDLYYEVMSGNSDALALDGRPVFHQYESDMGCYQKDLAVDGGTF